MEESVSESVTLPDKYDTTAIVYITTSSLFATAGIVWALRTVFVHNKLAEIVKFYFYCEHGFRLVTVLEYLLWGVPCIIWDLETNAPAVNIFMGFIFQTLSTSVCVAQLALSINRFFAIAYEGRYYRKISTNRAHQALLIIVVPMVPGLVLFLPDSHTIFDVSSYGFNPAAGTGAMVYTVVVQGFVQLFIWAGSMILDVIILNKLHKKRQQNNGAHSTSLHTEWKLAMQMIVNHLSNIINLAVGITIVLTEWESFYNFLLVTVLILLLPGFYGLNVVFFLRVQKRRMSITPVKCALT